MNFFVPSIYSEYLADSSTDDIQQTQNDEDEETDAEVSIGTEIPDHEQIGDVLSHQHIPQDDDNDHGNLLQPPYI